MSVINRRRCMGKKEYILVDYIENTYAKIAEIRPCLLKNGKYSAVDLITKRVCEKIGDGILTGGYDQQ